MTGVTNKKTALCEERVSGKSILFLGHDAGRTGAVIVLLHFLRWLKENQPEIAIDILLQRGGDLVPMFKELGKTRIREAAGSKAASLIAKIRRHLFPKCLTEMLDVVWLRWHYGIFRKPSLIFANTVTHGDLLHALRFIGCPVVSHIHELEYWISYNTPARAFQRVKEQTTQYVAASAAVKSNLVLNHGILEHEINVVHEFIPAAIITPESTSRQRTKIRAEWNIPDDACIIGMCGTLEWRKGVDFLALLASLCLRRHAEMPFYFVWIGGDANEATANQVLFDSSHLGVSDRIRFLGKRLNPSEDFAAIDIFALLSREDAFPLACLEAAAAGKPVVCFASAGGMPEFVESDCGIVVPYLDLEAMSFAINSLWATPELREQLGKRASQKTLEMCSTAVQAPKLWEILKRQISQCDKSIVSNGH
jgi:glycosyltransferase involved in cell wall biosynthesis